MLHGLRGRLLHELSCSFPPAPLEAGERQLPQLPSAPVFFLALLRFDRLSTPRPGCRDLKAILDGANIGYSTCRRRGGEVRDDTRGEIHGFWQLHVAGGE